jgi:hypothetical protein
MINDVVHGDAVMDLHIFGLKATLAIRNTHPPCHIIADPHHFENIEAPFQSGSENESRSWIDVVNQYQQNAMICGPVI